MMTLWSNNDAIIWDKSNSNIGFSYFSVCQVESGKLMIEASEGFSEKIFEYEFVDEDTLILTDYYTNESSTYERR